MISSRLATRSSLLALALAGVVAGTLAGCGGDDGGSGGNAVGGDPGNGGGGFSNSGGSSTGGFEACATATLEGERIPVQMYIMFDKSGSMLMDQKWAGAKAALIAFFQDADSAGLNVALRFFPDDEPVAGCNETACSTAACATPLVPVGTLNAQTAVNDPQQAALVAAVESRNPSGQTPLYSALAGATEWAVQNFSADLTTAVVLVTDGEPNDSCNQPNSAIAPLAASASAAGVFTYAIGMVGADIALLDDIAQAGGSDQAFVVGNGSIHQDLIDAFQKIGTAPLACNLPMPEPAELGDEVNPGEVNLSYTPSDGAAQTIPQVGSAAECGDEPGWYYDDPSQPSELILCPASCTTVQDDAGATLEVILGCKTVLK